MKAIDNSPRKRHHIRFWSLSLARAEDDEWQSSQFLGWNTSIGRGTTRASSWVGAGTKGIRGLSFTRLTFQVTHATDSDTNAERDYIIGELREKRVIEAITEYQSGQLISTNHVNHYVTDVSEVTLANLVAVGAFNRLSARGADRRMGQRQADVGAGVLGSAGA